MGGSGGKPFAVQQLQHIVKYIKVSWDSFSIREINLIFSNGRQKTVGSTWNQTKIENPQYKFYED